MRRGFLGARDGRRVDAVSLCVVVFGFLGLVLLAAGVAWVSLVGASWLIEFFEANGVVVP
jgi:hypothetical protein